MYDRWVRASSAGNLSGIVLLDLSAAFDLVDRELLIKKLRMYKFDKLCGLTIFCLTFFIVL